eukprot:TRINITY_DN19_c0_g1_i1.p1 TRINITY_DN19_c0_g1~~TRINITY_DN19_c0_g1_i1.p1  ORF type:complete len:237 (-),score=55.61 TRINITY_DN19_c0_g1_i1:4-714(-)
MQYGGLYVLVRVRGFFVFFFFFFQAEDGIRDVERSRGLGDVYKRQVHGDGLWAVLAWLSILADKNKDKAEGAIISVENIVKEYWATFGRNYYSRYDYENMDIEQGNKVFELLQSRFAEFEKAYPGGSARVFEYKDKIDGSLSKNQGLIFTYSDGSRFVFRKSGTGTVGVTLRIYLEAYSKDKLDLPTEVALKQVVADALKYSQINEISGRSGPTVVTQFIFYLGLKKKKKKKSTLR